MSVQATSDHIGHGDQSEIFLTGATGVLGAHVLKRLLAETSHRVHCLVRAGTQSEGRARLYSFLKVYDPQETLRSQFDERVHAVLGDVTQEYLGLGEDGFNALAGRIDSTLHVAASTNLFLTFRRIEPINVGGTRRMIEFALRTPSKYLCYISTYTVMGSKVFDASFRFTEDKLDAGQTFEHMAYQQSKFIGENMVREAQTRGLVWNIMRPGQVFGEAETAYYPSGQTNVSGLFLDIFKTVMETGVAFRSTTHFDVVPVDFVSAAILHLGLARKKHFETYHLLNPDIKTYSQVIGLIRSLGYVIHNVEQSEYRRMLFENDLRSNGQVYKSPTSKGFKWWFQREVFDFEKSAVTDCRYTYDILRSAGIECPPIDQKLIGKYVRYGVQQGYFPRVSDCSSPQYEIHSAEDGVGVLA